MSKQSAGILLYRKRAGTLEVLLVHPGGPFWVKKDNGAWSIPKGEFSAGEDPNSVARREFLEETGVPLEGGGVALKPVRQSGGKMVYAWAMQGNVDAAAIKSNTFTLEWPPRSGKTQEFPEVDRAAWFRLEVARKKILKSQLPLLEQLEKIL